MHGRRIKTALSSRGSRPKIEPCLNMLETVSYWSSCSCGLTYFVKISEESIRTDKIELSVLDRYFTICFSSSICFSVTGKSETWKKSHHERDPSVRDIFSDVACLIIGAGNERREGILRVP